MRRARLSLLLACTISLVGCLHASGRDDAPGVYDEEFQNRIGGLGRSFESLNPDQVSENYAPDTFAHAFELPYNWDTGGKEHHDTLEKFLGAMQDLKFAQTDKVQVWRRRGKVWTLQGVSVTGKLKNGRDLAFDGRHSAIWEKRDGRWVIVHEHYWGPQRTAAIISPAEPPPGPPPAPAPPVAAVTPPPAPPPVPEPELADIFFDFDRSEVRPDQQPTVTADAEWLRARPSVKLTIEGHCDERGTRAYNMALGSRRAESMKEALVAQGVNAKRLRTVSYGKERPFELGHDESAWSKNRRAHLVEQGKKK